MFSALDLDVMRTARATRCYRRASLFISLPLACLSAIFTAVPIHARLAEKREQIEARYGKALTKQDSAEIPGLFVCRYEYNGMSITVTYIQGTCYGEEYVCQPGKELSQEGVRVLLEANCCGLLWLTSQQLDDAKHPEILRDGTVVSRVNTTFQAGGNWLLCNPNLFYDPCAGASWTEAVGTAPASLSVRSFSIKKYVDDARALRANASLKGF